MRINADPAVRVAVHAARLPWIASPSAGVWRRMLSRIGDEQAQATSIVRYDPGSQFPRHLHPGGEEILVLDGVFEDESGDWPAGAYLRSPDGSSHAPASKNGCTLFVKLRQIPDADTRTVRLLAAQTGAGNSGHRGNADCIELFRSPYELVQVGMWAAGQHIELANPGGLELLVLDGGFEESGENFCRLSWLRLPPSHDLRAKAGANGCRAWIKTGHLAG